MLRGAKANELADKIEREGWDTSVLRAVEQAARDADRETEDELERAREVIEWVYRWKKIHPQFNTVD